MTLITDTWVAIASCLLTEATLTPSLAEENSSYWVETDFICLEIVTLALITERLENTKTNAATDIYSMLFITMTLYLAQLIWGWTREQTRAPHVGALYARKMSRSINSWWKHYLSLTSAFICSSSDSDQSSYQVQWLSLINFSWYWADTIFCIKCYCDLDLWPSDLKMYRGQLMSMTNLHTLYHDCHSWIFQGIKWKWFLHRMLLWPWHLTSDFKICMGHLLTTTNHPTKYHDCHSKAFQDIERTRFLN